MRGDIGLAFEHALFQLLDEQALAADLGQRGVENLVALGAHGQQFDLEPGIICLQPAFHMLGLPQREWTLAGGDTNQLFHLAASVAKWAAIITVEPARAY